MTTPLRLTRPAKIHCFARLLGVSGCFRSNQSSSVLALVSVTAPIWHESKVPLTHGTCEPELWTAAGGPNDNYKSPPSKAEQQASRHDRTQFRHRQWWIDGLMESIIRARNCG